MLDHLCISCGEFGVLMKCLNKEAEERTGSTKRRIVDTTALLLVLPRLCLT